MEYFVWLVYRIMVYKYYCYNKRDIRYKDVLEEIDLDI